MANFERIADALAEELRTYHEEEGDCDHSVGVCSCSVKDALLAYKKAKERDYIVDVDELSCKSDGPHRAAVQASHLGWTPGFWPLVIRFGFTVLRNQRPIMNDGRLSAVVYDDGFTFVKVYND